MASGVCWSYGLNCRSVVLDFGRFPVCLLVGWLVLFYLLICLFFVVGLILFTYFFFFFIYFLLMEIWCMLPGFALSAQFPLLLRL